MKFRSSFALAAGALVLGGLWFSGCDGPQPIAPEAEGWRLEQEQPFIVSPNGTNNPTVDLMTRRSVDVGNVSFDDVDTNGDGVVDALEVRYTTSAGWKLHSVDLWIGASLESMPDTRKGDPKPRKFPYRDRRINDTTWVVTVPFTEIGYQCGNFNPWYVAAHAVVRKQVGRWFHTVESAWSADTRFRETRGRWATYTTIVITCDKVAPPPDQCETAYAYGNGAACFYDLTDADDNALFAEWGWTNPIAPGSTTMDLFAKADGAGSCDLAGAYKVGTVSISYVANTLTVTVDAEPLFGLDDVALFYGSMPYPVVNGVPTVDPSQFPVQVSGLGKTPSWTFSQAGVTGNQFIILRAKVCGPF
ncbi:MAG: hypothetical protein MUE68_12780 [Bacteroidetes bacterium]|jgi:hypothetical protein|nr:hypothetical protein [Bacteroidota bacterium]